MSHIEQNEISDGEPIAISNKKGHHSSFSYEIFLKFKLQIM